MRQLVIVPTYNERENLARLAAALLDHTNVHRMVVDDASPDGTGAIADDLASRSHDRTASIGAAQTWTLLYRRHAGRDCDGGRSHRPDGCGFLSRSG